MGKKLYASIVLIVLVFNILSSIFLYSNAETIDVNENVLDSNVSQENNSLNEEKATTNSEKRESKNDKAALEQQGTEEETIKNEVEVQEKIEEIEEIEEIEKIEETDQKLLGTPNEETVLKLEEDTEEQNEEKFEEEKISLVKYYSHIQDYGWEEEFIKVDGETSGTEGKSKRIEAIKIALGNSKEITKNASIKYQAHVQDIGWQDWKKDGELSGTTGQNKRIEAIKIKIEGIESYSVIYRTHVEDYGWTKWTNNGEISGTIGEGKRIEAIQIKIVKNPSIEIKYTYNASDNTEKATIISDKQLSAIDDDTWILSEDKLSYTKVFYEDNKYNFIVQDIDEIQRNIEINITQIKEPGIEYQAHVQNIGWQNSVEEDKAAGTIGQSKGIEALKINFVGIDGIGNIKYQVHSTDIGWQNWVSNNEQAGTTGKSKSIEAIKIELEDLKNYSVEYRVHISDYGWQKWRKNGEIAGTTGQSKKIEAIQIRISYIGTETLEPEVSYKSHVQDIGWQDTTAEGFTSGTEGRSKRIEAMQIQLLDVKSNAKVLYRTHVQDIGWQGWKSNGAITGTTGQSKRIEAIQIKLDGLDEYTVEYKVHIQDYGWSEWMIDGETAGTTGKSKRIEAIQIRIVPKYYRKYFGIDVSEFNGNINWQAVKNSGVQFAMIRCGYRGYRTGKIVEDAQFRNNITGAISNGIKVGLYFFSQAVSITEGIEEANYVTNLARQYNITYPIAIDSEISGADNRDGRADGLNQAVRTNVAVAFCNQIKNNGYMPMVYASRNWLYNNLEVNKLSQYETWLAHYTGSVSSRSDYKYSYTMWQYTSSGTISGIGTRVDLNEGYKHY